MNFFLHDIGVAIIVATLVGILTHLLKQPMIVGYLVAGIIIGPEVGPTLLKDPENVKLISEIGLILLLFMIGLEINVRALLASGKQLIYAGVGQFLLSVPLGILFFSFLFPASFSGDNNSLFAFYMAILASLSSTAIVVKSLYDKFELDSLAGRISVGILVLQDFWAIMVLVLQPEFHDPHLNAVFFAVGKSVLLLAAGFLVSKYLLARIFELITRNPEMIVATSIGWCAMMAATAGALGLSVEMGALIAGLSVASFPYSIHVTAKVNTLRDVFLTLFFISLGMEIHVPTQEYFAAVPLVVLFVLLSRFLAVMPLVKLGGGSFRTGFIASLNLAQVSEFSMVIAALGLKYGHIDEKTALLVIYSMAITALISIYLIKYNYQIFNQFAGLFRSKKEEKPAENQPVSHREEEPIVILGYHRGARALIDFLIRKNPQIARKFLVIDYNLEILKELQDKRITAVFGDISSVDTLEHLHIGKASMILSTIPDIMLKGTNNLTLVKSCRSLAPNAIIIATADTSEQIHELKKAGANEVILPYQLAAEFLANLILRKSALNTILAENAPADGI